ncbi:MAG: glycosyltransferase [Methanosarcina sp.]
MKVSIMKVNFIGNTCNNAYAIVKFLRKAGVDAHLFYNKTLDIQTMPYSEDPELLHNSPDWLHPFSEEDTGPHPLRTLRKEFLDKLADCDLIQAEDVGISWAMQTGKPYIWIPYGWDLNFYSFYSYWQKHLQNEFPEYLFAPILYRRAIANSSAVIWGLYDQNLRHGFQLINDLVSKERFVHNNTLLIDTNRFIPQKDHTVKELLDEAGKDIAVEGITIFFPSRLMFSENTYYSKRSDVLLYAAGKLKETGIPFTLIIVEKGNPDEILAKEIIKSLGIGERTVWIPKMERHQLVKWYSTADVTADEFASGAIGSLALEAMACKGTVMTYFKPVHDDPASWPVSIAFGTNPPLINVHDVQDTFEALKYYSEHKDELAQIGDSGREWIEKTISGEATARGFIDLYNKILADKNAPARDMYLSLTTMPEKKKCEEYVGIVDQLMAENKDAEAYDSVFRFLDKAPDNSRLMLSLIKLLIKQGKALFAIETLKHAIELMPNEELFRLSLYEIYRNIYKYFINMADLQNSIYFCEAAVKMMNHELLKSKKVNEADSTAENKRIIENADDHLTLADLYIKAGRYQELLKLLESVERNFPRSDLSVHLEEKFRNEFSKYPNNQIKIRKFGDIASLSEYLGFARRGHILEENIDVMDHECDLFARKRHDAEVLTTVAANVKGKCFDIGTSFGASAYKLATNVPDSGVVYTVNILPEQFTADTGKLITHMISKEEIGAFFRERNIKNIVQLYANTITWQIPDELNDLDIVFVDGGHDAFTVYSDTKNIYDRVKEGGFILWHDFNPMLRNVHPWINEVMNGIERFLKELNITDEVLYLKDSWIGILRKKSRIMKEELPPIPVSQMKRKVPLRSMRELKYLMVYPAFSDKTIKNNEKYVEGLIRSTGLNISCSHIPCNGSWLPFPQLDKDWKEQNPVLMKAYEELMIKAYQADVLINAGGSMLHPDFVKQLPTYNVFMCGDDPESSEILSKPIAPSYDLCLVTNIASLDDYKTWGCKNVKWIFHPIHDDFLDNNLKGENILFGNRTNDLIFLSERSTLSNRDQRIMQLMKYFPQAIVRGNGWPGGFLEDLKEQYLHTKIGWNFHHSTGPTNRRTFELPALGLMQLCDNKTNLGKIYKLDSEAIGFDSIEECIEKTRYYLAHDNERREIAFNGWKRTIEEFTIGKWWDKIIEYVEPGYRAKKGDGTDINVQVRTSGLPAASNQINVNVPAVGQKRDANRKKILLIADVPGWIFERHCKTIIKYLSSEFDFEIFYMDQTFDEDDYDLIYPLEFNLVDFRRIKNPLKYITGIRSHWIWEHSNFEELCQILNSRYQRIHTVSNRLYEIFKHYIKQISYVTHGVDSLFFVPSVPQSAEHGKLRVGWAGNREVAVKGFKEFIAPLSLIPGVELVFVGFKDTNLEMGEMLQFYNSIDVYICASVSEGNNNSLLEAASMERAIITTDTGTVNEYLINGHNAIIVKRELPEIISAVEKLRDNPDFRIAMGKEARKAVVEKFDWKQKIEDYRDLFRIALNHIENSGKPDLRSVNRISMENSSSELKKRGMNIVHVNTEDYVGGAARVAYRLSESQYKKGHIPVMFVGSRKNQNAPFEIYNVFEKQPASYHALENAGLLYYSYQKSHGLINFSKVKNADILHLHNLHGGYFNPFSLIFLSAAKPLVWTLHDMQAITGHCAHSLDCGKWETGCSNCPSLNTYPAIPMDSTSRLFNDKRLVYNNIFVNLVSPSYWLKSKVEKSILSKHSVEVIPNGVNTSVFKPLNKKKNRAKYKIPDNALIIGCVAQGGIQNEWKGGYYAAEIIKSIKEKNKNVIFLNIGASGDSGVPYIVNIPFVADETILNEVYSLLDVFLFTSIAENCPLVILEALACGIPIVSFNTGGIPELVRNGIDGFIAGYKDTSEAIYYLEKILRDHKLRMEMGKNARENAVTNFDHDIIANKYEKLYLQTMDEYKIWKQNKGIQTLSLSEIPSEIQTGPFLDTYRKITENELKLAPNSQSFRLNGEVDLSQQDDSVKISAIVSTYNSEKFIRQCLEDLVSQTLYLKSQLEIVIVNSGSQQNEEAIIKQYQAKYSNIKYIRTEQRETVYQAWNRGIKAASGKYLTNANTDDRHRRDGLEILVNLLENNPDKVLAYGDSIVTKVENETFENCTIDSYLRWPDFEKFRMLEFCFIGPHPVWRKSVHEEYGYFDKNYVTAADYEFWLRLAQKNEFIHTNELVGLYWLNEGTVSRKGDKPILEAQEIKGKYKELYCSERSKLLDKNKILFVTHNFPPYWFAGVENYAFNLVNELKKTGYDVHVIYPRIDLNAAVPSIVKKKYQDIEVYELIHNNYDPLATELNSKAIEKVFEEFLIDENYGLAHFHHTMGLSYPFIWSAKKLGVKTCLTLHDFWLMCPRVHLLKDDDQVCNGPKTIKQCAECLSSNYGNVEKKSEKLESIISSRLHNVKSLFKEVDYISSPSEFLASKFVEYGFTNGEIHISELGLSLNEGKIKEGVPETVTFGYIGTIAPVKNVLMLVEAFKKAKTNSRLVIWGNGLANEIEKLKILISGCDNILYKGVFNPAQIESVLSDVDMVIVPSKIESYCFTLREALHFKIPVIASNRGGIPEIIKQKKNGFLFNPDNVQDLSDLIKKVSNNPSIITELRKNISSVRNIEKDGKYWDYCYRQLLGINEKNTRNSESEVKISVIIPVFNKLEYTKKCLYTIYRNSGNEINYEVIIIDNASSDGTAEFLEKYKIEHPNLIVYKSETNLGFAKANNIGAKIAKGEYILCLNNDTEPKEGWLEPLVRIIEGDKTVGAVGSKLLFPDGKIQHAGVVIINDNVLPDPLVARHIYWMSNANIKDVNILKTYQALTAACLLIRKSVFDEVGGFDEEYWNGYEDIDLCFKLREKGWKLVYQPQSVVIHYESQSGPERFSKVSKNIERLHKKWLGKIKPDFIIEKDGKASATTSNVIKEYLHPEQNVLENVSNIEGITETFVSIIVLTYNGLKYNKEFINSVLKYTKAKYEIIAVDNASTDGTVEYLEDLRNMRDNIKVVFNESNLGFPMAVNQALKAASGNYVLIANNDIVVTDGWLERMLEVAESDNTAGIVGPVSNAVSGLQIDKNAKYKNITEMHKYAKKVRKQNAGKTLAFPRVAFLCTLIKKEVIDTIGGLDERFTPGNFEDDDFCLRAQLSGYKTIIAQDVFIHHYGSKSFKADGEQKYFERLNINKEKFIDKWGGDSDEIWLKGKSVKKRSLKVPINKNELTENFERALVQLEDREFDYAMGSLKEAISISKSSEVKNDRIRLTDLLNLAGNTALILEDYESAKEYFEEELKLAPDSSGACRGLGEVFFALEIYDAAKSMFEWAVKNDPQNKMAASGLAKINTQLGLSEKDNSLFENSASALTGEKQLKNDGENSMEISNAAEFKQYFDEAFNLYQAKQYKDSLMKLYEAENYYSDSNNYAGINLVDLNVLRGTIYLLLEDLNNSRVSFEKALNLDPSSSEACSGLGEILFRTGLMQEAKTMFEWAVQNDPQSLGAKARLAKANRELGLHDDHCTIGSSGSEENEAQNLVDEAYELFQKKQHSQALSKLLLAEDMLEEIEPDSQRTELSASISNFKGFNYLAMNKLDKAKQNFEQALSINPESSQACAGLGEIFYLSEKDQEAKTMYEWAVKNDPQNSFAINGLAKVNKAMGHPEMHNSLISE